MAKAVISQKQTEKDPTIFWNAFIDVVGGGEDPTRTPIQKHCHLCFRYYSEVMNGGHYQFFENNGIDYARDVLTSFHGLGLVPVAAILEEALKIAATRQWQVIASVEEFVEGALDEPFKFQDDAFYSVSPDLFEQTLEVAMRQKDEFFTIVP